MEKTLGTVYCQYRGLLWGGQCLKCCKMSNKVFIAKVRSFFEQTSYAIFEDYLSALDVTMGSIKRKVVVPLSFWSKEFIFVRNLYGISPSWYNCCPATHGASYCQAYESVIQAEICILAALTSNTWIQQLYAVLFRYLAFLDCSMT